MWMFTRIFNVIQLKKIKIMKIKTGDNDIVKIGQSTKIFTFTVPYQMNICASWWWVRKRYNPPPLTAMWMNSESSQFFLDCVGYQQ